MVNQDFNMYADCLSYPCELKSWMIQQNHLNIYLFSRRTLAEYILLNMFFLVLKLLSSNLPNGRLLAWQLHGIECLTKYANLQNRFFLIKQNTGVLLK